MANYIKSYLKNSTKFGIRNMCYNAGYDILVIYCDLIQVWFASTKTRRDVS